MKKELLIKYISGEATPEQEREILDWIIKSDYNKKYYMDLKNLWVAQTIPQNKATKEELICIQKLTTKNEFARYKRRGILMYISSSVAVAAVIALIFTVFAKGYKSAEQVNELVRVTLADIPNEYRHEVYTEKGVKAKVVLPDSSVVWLNSESRITYPDKFIGSTREIEFSGEAFFKITKDSLTPMIIKTERDFIVKVMGTTFNLKSYKNDKTAKATLYTGIIDIISTVRGSKEQFKTTRLSPNDICIVENNKPLILSKVNTNIAKKESAWKDGRIVFESARMEDVIKIIKRWHGVDIIVEDPQILDYKITADFESESIIQIAEMLRYCSLIDYKISDNKVYFKKR